MAEGHNPSQEEIGIKSIDFRTGDKNLSPEVVAAQQKAEATLAGTRDIQAAETRTSNQLSHTGEQNPGIVMGTEKPVLPEGWNGKVVMEIGPGYGAINARWNGYEEGKDDLGKTALILVDVDPKSVDAGMLQRLKDQGYGHVQFVQGDGVEALHSLPPGTIDRIDINNVLTRPGVEASIDLRGLVQAAGEKLKPGEGKLRIVETNTPETGSKGSYRLSDIAAEGKGIGEVDVVRYADNPKDPRFGPYAVTAEPYRSYVVEITAAPEKSGNIQGDKVEEKLSKTTQGTTNAQPPVDIFKDPPSGFIQVDINTPHEDENDEAHSSISAGFGLSPLPSVQAQEARPPTKYINFPQGEHRSGPIISSDRISAQEIQRLLGIVQDREAPAGFKDIATSALIRAGVISTSAPKVVVDIPQSASPVDTKKSGGREKEERTNQNNDPRSPSVKQPDSSVPNPNSKDFQGRSSAADPIPGSRSLLEELLKEPPPRAQAKVTPPEVQRPDLDDLPRPLLPGERPRENVDVTPKDPDIKRYLETGGVDFRDLGTPSLSGRELLAQLAAAQKIMQINGGSANIIMARPAWRNNGEKGQWVPQSVRMDVRFFPEGTPQTVDIQGGRQVVVTKTGNTIDVKPVNPEDGRRIKIGDYLIGDGRKVDVSNISDSSLPIKPISISATDDPRAATRTDWGDPSVSSILTEKTILIATMTQGARDRVLYGAPIDSGLIAAVGRAGVSITGPSASEGRLVDSISIDTRETSGQYPVNIVLNSPGVGDEDPSPVEGTGRAEKRHGPPQTPKEQTPRSQEPSPVKRGGVGGRIFGNPEVRTVGETPRPAPGWTSSEDRQQPTVGQRIKDIGAAITGFVGSGGRLGPVFNDDGEPINPRGETKDQETERKNDDKRIREQERIRREAEARAQQARAEAERRRQEELRLQREAEARAAQAAREEAEQRRIEDQKRLESEARAEAARAEAERQERQAQERKNQETKGGNATNTTPKEDDPGEKKLDPKEELPKEVEPKDETPTKKGKPWWPFGGKGEKTSSPEVSVGGNENELPPDESPQPQETERPSNSQQPPQSGGASQEQRSGGVYGDWPEIPETKGNEPTSKKGKPKSEENKPPKGGDGKPASTPPETGLPRPIGVEDPDDNERPPIDMPGKSPDLPVPPEPLLKPGDVSGKTMLGRLGDIAETISDVIPNNPIQQAIQDRNMARVGEAIKQVQADIIAGRPVDISTPSVSGALDIGRKVETTSTAPTPKDLGLDK